jgi:hypothetical protein
MLCYVLPEQTEVLSRKVPPQDQNMSGFDEIDCLSRPICLVLLYVEACACIRNHIHAHMREFSQTQHGYESRRVPTSTGHAYAFSARQLTYPTFRPPVCGGLGDA